METHGAPIQYADWLRDIARQIVKELAVAEAGTLGALAPGPGNARAMLEVLVRQHESVET